MCSAAGTACSRSFVASTQTWYTVQCGRQRAALRSEHVQDHLAHGGKGAQARWADGGAFFDNRPGNWGGSGLKRSRSGACQCGWARAWRRAASRLCILQAMRQNSEVQSGVLHPCDNIYEASNDDHPNAMTLDLKRVYVAPDLRGPTETRTRTLG